MILFLLRVLGILALMTGFYLSGSYGVRGDRLHDGLWFIVGVAGMTAYGYACGADTAERMRKATVKLFAGAAGTAKTRLLEAVLVYEREHGQLSETELRDMLPPRPTRPRHDIFKE